TGRATREFLFVEDAAAGIVAAAERHDGAEPINLGTGEEISIRELAKMIARLTGFAGEFTWDETQPDGQPRERLDVSRAEEWIRWRAQTRLEEGLRKTVAWYQDHIRVGPERP